MIKTAIYFAQRTTLLLIFKTTNTKSCLRKHPKETILVQMGEKNRKKKKLQNVFHFFPLRGLIAIVIRKLCQLSLYTHTHRDKERHKEKSWLSQVTYTQIANHKKLHVSFLQLSRTAQHNSHRGNLCSKKKIEDDIRT